MEDLLLPCRGFGLFPDQLIGGGDEDHIPWSQEIIPTSWISLASTLSTQGLFIPIAGDA